MRRPARAVARRLEDRHAERLEQPEIDRARADRVAARYACLSAVGGPVRDVVKNARHPYTVGLMGSIPLLGADVEALSQIDGAMPRLNAIPTGCAYHPRCPRAFDRCRVERPLAIRVGNSDVACHLYDGGERHG